MKRKEFEEAVTGLVWVWINNRDLQGENAQIRVNPELLYVDLLTQSEFQEAVEDSDEVIENAAYAFGGRDEENADEQARQNPDFYPARTLVKKEDGKTVPDPNAIETLAANYF